MSDIQISFDEYEEVAPENEYRETIEKMIEVETARGVDSSQTKEPKGKVIAKMECDKSDALKIRTLIASAANEQNRTARMLKNAEPVKDKNGKPTERVLIWFVLNPKHKPRRKGTGKNGPVVTSNVADKDK